MPSETAPRAMARPTPATTATAAPGAAGTGRRPAETIAGADAGAKAGAGAVKDMPGGSAGPVPVPAPALAPSLAPDLAPAPALAGPVPVPLPLPLTLPVPLGTLGLRLARADDAAAYVGYWSGSSADRLRALGVDTDRLGDAAEIEARFLRLVPGPDLATMPTLLMTFTLNGHVIGYSNVNRHGERCNYAHLHFYNRGLRQALLAAAPGGPGRTDPRGDAARAGAGAGPGSIAVPAIGLLIEVVFSLLPVARVTAQTRSRNRLVNAALDHYRPADEIRQVDQPDGLSLPGQFQFRHFDRADLDHYRQRTRSLAGQGPTSL